MIEKHPERGFDTEIDQVQIDKMLYISYALKTFKLIILTLNISYFLGMFWLLFCELSVEFTRDVLEMPVDHHFWYYFDIDPRSEYERTVMTVYYSFTTLSTVGFGDYHPRSDSERLMIAFILPFGVAIFSFIMGNFLDILSQFNEIHAVLEESDALQ